MNFNKRYTCPHLECKCILMPKTSSFLSNTFQILYNSFTTWTQVGLATIYYFLFLLTLSWRSKATQLQYPILNSNAPDTTFNVWIWNCQISIFKATKWMMVVQKWCLKNNQFGECHDRDMEEPVIKMLCK